MTAHAKLFSPSSADRWMVCTESPYLNMGPDVSGSAALEGSAAHKLGELVLIHGGKCADYIGKEIDVFDDGATLWTVDKDMAYYIQDYVDYCNEQIHPFGSYATEQRYDLTHLGEDMFGTGDFTAISDDELVIVDLKYGKGIKVDAVENRQLKIYASGAIEKYGMLYDFEKVRTVVFQPRLENVVEDVYTLEEFDAFNAEVRAVTKGITAKKDLVRVATEKGCKWCAAKGTCGVYAEAATAQARDAFADVGFEPTKPELTPEDRAIALTSIPLLKAWIKAIEEQALSDVERGIEIPGFKVVAGRSFRKWGDPNEVLEVMKKSRSVKEDDYLDKKLLTVAQLEKVLRSSPAVWKKVSPLITKAEGKHTLVPESDKRPSIGTPADQFKGIT